MQQKSVDAVTENKTNHKSQEIPGDAKSVTGITSLIIARQNEKPAKIVIK